MLHGFRRAVSGDFDALQQMLELYQYELSDIWHQELDAEGRYGYDLRKHRQGLECFAYVALKDGVHAGFALVSPAWVTRTQGLWMEQFFVLKRYRRSGLGRAFARHVLASHPGPWEVGQMTANAAAQVFWRSVIGELCAGAFAEHEITEGPWQGVVQQFDLASRMT